MTSTRLSLSAAALTALLVPLVSCGAERAGTVTFSYATPVVGATFDPAANPDVVALQVVAVGGRGGAVPSSLVATPQRGGRGCQVTVTVLASGGVISSVLGANGGDAPTSGAALGGSGWIGGGQGGQALRGLGGASGGGATGVFRGTTLIAVAAGGGGAGTSGAGGSACGLSTADGQVGSGLAPGAGAQVAGTTNTPGAGGTTAGTTGTFFGLAGQCPTPVYATSGFTVPWSGGLGGANNYSSPTNAGGGGGAGLCGGGGGAPDIAGSLTSSGGGAGLSYGATFDGCAAPTYVATPAAPGVSYRWITMATTPTQYTTAGTTVSYTYAATFGPLGTVGSSINGDYAVVAGSLPTGMTLDPATGVVSGRPYFGQYPFTLEATVRSSDGTIIARSRHAYLINVASGGSSEFQP